MWCPTPFLGHALFYYFSGFKREGNEMSGITGVIPLYKPRGMTSHDCVNILRKLLRTKKVGHTGTLDPDVDGVLPMCIGRATKIVQYLTNDGKTYEGVIALGSSTTTEDGSGVVIEEKAVQDTWNRMDIEKVFQRFTGEIEQVPPMYSAVKVNGKKLYEYARSGIPVERPTRKVTIYRLELPPGEKRVTERIPFVVECSKGTYIRTLTVDIGRALGYPAHMETLTRTRSGQFHLKDCYTFDQIEQAVSNQTIHELVTTIGVALQSMDSWVVDEETEKEVQNGKVLPMPKNFQSEQAAVYNKHGDCLAIYCKHPTKTDMIKPVKVLSIGEDS
jgi:tRNA pseudouridine55 synthase